MKKLLFILTLILSGLLWYVMVPAAPTPSAGRPPLMESFSYPYLGKKLPRPLRLCYLAYHMKDVAKDRIDKSDWVSLDNMPAYLPQALIATEDRRFYSHIGIDPSAIMRAVLVNLQYDEVAQGGSTLTQQLVKNNLLSPERSLERKLWEAGLALIVEARYSKEEILEMYFNTTFFGNHSTGIRRAARNYFGIEPKQLSLMECAVLAGLPNAPTDLNPYNDMEACRRRRDLVLENMHDQGFITGNQLNHAKKADIVLR